MSHDPLVQVAYYNPESRHPKSRIPALKEAKSRIPKNLLGILLLVPRVFLTLNSKMADKVECSFQAIPYFCYQFTSIFDNDVSTISIAYRISKLSICGNLSVVKRQKTAENCSEW